MIDWTGKRVTVFGLGRTGEAVARYLQSRGATVLITDSGNTEAQQAAAVGLREDGIEVELGGHSDRCWGEADALVLSPGVPPGITPIVAGAARGIPVMSELEAVWGDCRAPILAVTGTNGKTTTTALLHHVLEAAGLRTVLCGNNDVPLSSALMQSPTPDFYVVEVSSYQLETAHEFRPRVAAMLNVTPDHPRHGAIENYAAVKARIFQAQGEGDTAVMNADDPLTANRYLPPGVQRTPFSLAAPCSDGVWVNDGVIRYRDETILQVSELPIPGRHNLANVLAVVAMARAAGVPAEQLAAGIRSFRGVPHRIEFVRELQGTRYYNDSKSTNIDSLRVALESFSQPIVLIAGGRGKGAGYGSLEPLVRRQVRALVLIGEDGPKMAAAWGHAVPSLMAGSMSAAVQQAHDIAEPGDVVLLSPGCASFDWYNNFEERGADFRSCVAGLAAAAPVSEDMLHGA